MSALYTSSFFSLSFFFFFVPPLCVINKDSGGITISSISPCVDTFHGRSTYSCNPSTRRQLICSRSYHLRCCVYLWNVSTTSSTLGAYRMGEEVAQSEKSFNSYQLQVIQKKQFGYPSS